MNQKGFSQIILSIVIVSILVLVGGAVLYYQNQKSISETQSQESSQPQIKTEESPGVTSQKTSEEKPTETAVEKQITKEIPKQPTPTQTQPQQPPPPSWKYGGVAIAGKFADADIVDLGNGQYRLYYSAEPEVPGFSGQVYSALSQDGVTWQQENGIRLNWATFPSVLKLPDGRYRMYFQNQGVIKSAISSDGLSWNEEPGTRINNSESGFNIDVVGGPTTMLLGDGTYIMVYHAAINQKYPADVPNSTMSLFFYAVSKDGLNFEKKGLALDSRNANFKGWTQSPEWVKWDNGELRIYFWSYKGVYHITYKDGGFPKEAVFDYTTNTNPWIQFPENPPGDPTLAKINGKWFMYYGQHTKGIYYAEQK